MRKKAEYSAFFFALNYKFQNLTNLKKTLLYILEFIYSFDKSIALSIKNYG